MDNSNYYILIKNIILEEQLVYFEPLQYLSIYWSDDLRS